MHEVHKMFAGNSGWLIVFLVAILISDSKLHIYCEEIQKLYHDKNLVLDVDFFVYFVSSFPSGDYKSFVNSIYDNIFINLCFFPKLESLIKQQCQFWFLEREGMMG